ncbi:unannotated protein [freshwater metagenome]|uniref:Unannotated protein n=1 Tax=freshwater metagenome TaxID=449393 RepID=A0A6J7EPA5_9ZZZZ
MPEATDIPLVQKLGIREGTRMCTVNAPANFREVLGDLPLAVEWANRLRGPLDLAVAFHAKRSGLVANWPALLAAVLPDGAIWIAWPKKASGLETDLTDIEIREVLTRRGWIDNKVCAIDDTWTALRFVVRKEVRKKRSGGPNKPAKLLGRRPGAHR